MPKTVLRAAVSDAPERVVSWALIVLAVAMTLCAFAAGARGATPAAAPDESVLQTPAKLVRELPKLRTRTSRTYVDEHGMYTAKVYAHSVNFQDADGIWQPIDNTLVRSGAGYRNKAAGYIAELPQSLAASPVKVTSGNAWLSFALRGAAGVARVSSDTATYNALTGVGVRYQARNDLLKEDLVLQNARAASQLVFDVRSSSGLSAVKLASGSIEYRDGAGKAQFTLPAPSMVDAAGNASSAVAYELKKTATGQTLMVVPDKAWLGAKGRAWPVTIDPSTALEPIPECTLDENAPTTSDCGAPSSGDLHVGWQSGKERRALMLFDIDATIPADADTFYAFVGLKMTTQSNASAGATTINVERVNRSWTSSASWNFYDGTHRWGAPGGNFPANAQLNGTADDMGGTGAPTMEYWAIPDAITDWHKHRNPNFGVIIRGKTMVNNLMGIDPDGTDGPYLGIRYSRRLGSQRGYKLEQFRLSDRISLSVNASNGNLMVDQTDFSVPGGLGPDTTVSRTYNSFDPGPDTKVLSTGWTLNTGGGLRMANDGNYYQYAYLPGAREAYFKPNGTSGSDTLHTTAAGLDARLVKKSSEKVLTFNSSQTSLRFQNNGAGVQDRLTEIRDRNNRSLTFAYVGSTFKTDTITDSQSRVTQFHYDGSGRIDWIKDPALRQYSYHYDATTGHLDTYTDPAGGVTRYYYDPYEHGLTKIVTPDGRVTLITYYPCGDPDVDKVKTITRVTNTTAGTGPTTTFVYDDHRDTSSDAYVTDPEGHETKYSFDDTGRVTKVTDALGLEQKNTYDAFSNVLEYSAPGASGSTPSTTSTADALGNLTGTKTGVGSRYLRTTTTFPSYTSGATTGANFQPTESRDTQGLKTSYGYDGAGNLNDVGGYDASNTLTSSVHLNYGDSSAPGKVTSSTDGRLHTTAYFYDTGGNLTSIEPYSTPTGGQPSGTSVSTQMGKTSISYGGHSGADQALSRPTSVTLPNGRSKAFDYDGLDRVTKITYSNGDHVDFTYDYDGNVTQVADSVNGTRTFTYDALGRITAQSGPGSYALSYEYDDNGNLTKFTDPSGSTEYGYDAANRLTAVYLPGVSAPIRYTLDKQGNRTKIEWPNGDVTEQTFDEANEMTRTCVRPSSDAAACTSSTTNRLLDFKYTYEQFAYPDSGSTAAQKALQDTVLDKDGNWTKYCYGGQNRLTRVEIATSSANANCTSGDNTESDWFAYAYDGAGNVTAHDRKSATTETYQYNEANELCWRLVGTSSNTCSSNPASSETFSYEADGSTGRNTGNESAQGGTGALRTATSYNVRNQIASFTTAGPTTTSLTFFGDGQDDLYKVGTTTHRSTILGLTQIGSDLYTRDNAGGLVAQNTANGQKYVHTDALGSVRAVTGSTGSVDYRLSYDPYGRALTGTGLSQPGASTIRFGYAGGEWITEGGFYHYGARFYDPALLRWTQPDPVLQPTDPGQANRYAYAAGDPVNRDDPSGTATAMGGCIEGKQNYQRGRSERICRDVFHSDVTTAEEYRRLSRPSVTGEGACKTIGLGSLFIPGGRVATAIGKAVGVGTLIGC